MSPLPPLPPKAQNGSAASAAAGSGDSAAVACAPEVAALSRAELLELVRRMEAAQEAEASNWRAQKRTLVAAVRKLRGEEAGASPAATEAAPATASS
jgi:TPP-dependent pyruvate/acetoin dehydrogenase alpha subunit